MPSLKVSDHLVWFLRIIFWIALLYGKCLFYHSSCRFSVMKWKIDLTRTFPSPFLITSSPSLDCDFHLRLILIFSLWKKALSGVISCFSLFFKKIRHFWRFCPHFSVVIEDLIKELGNIATQLSKMGLLIFISHRDLEL